MQRRQFIRQSAVLSTLAPLLPWFNKNLQTSMGLVVHSYAFRWQARQPSAAYPPFTDAMQLLTHAHKIGAGGIQTVVNDWTQSLSHKIRALTEQHKLFIEASIALPKHEGEVDLFAKNILRAREAGCDVVRTVCLSGRRYESFKSLAEFKTFKQRSLDAIRLALPVVQKFNLKLAVENHKDWLAGELVEWIKSFDHPLLGVTLDFGNNLALLEDPLQVVETLAPYAFSTHVKDMGVDHYADGFLLSEVVLGQGLCPLQKMVAICRQHNPAIRFNLEMITRDPLKIPCHLDTYWATYDQKNNTALQTTLDLVQKNKQPLPYVADLSVNDQHASEEKNVLRCLKFARKSLHLVKP